MIAWLVTRTTVVKVRVGLENQFSAILIQLCLGVSLRLCLLKSLQKLSLGLPSSQEGLCFERRVLFYEKNLN